jgi:hypothetical protein
VDWNVPIEGMEWTVNQTIAHIAEVCLWYAIDLAAGGQNLQTINHAVITESSPADLVSTLHVHATVAACVIDGADSNQGLHPLGLADRSGFAAMACDELLVHTHDAGRGLATHFEADRGLCARILRRLFPWVAIEGDAWHELLWANGRQAPPDKPRLKAWRWHCAPLGEWDGHDPFGIDSKAQGQV